MRMRVLGFAIVASVVAALLVPGAAVADPPATNFGATLTGDQVVPGPGAPDGFANAAGTLFPKRPSLVCGGFGNIQGA
jgi:hypothetical protein